MNFKKIIQSAGMLSLLFGMPLVAGQITLEWDGSTTFNDNTTALTGLSGYRVYWGATAGARTDNQLFSHTSNGGTVTKLLNVVDARLDPTRTYFFVVRAVANGLESLDSNEISGQPIASTTPPITPTSEPVLTRKFVSPTTGITFSNTSELKIYDVSGREIFSKSDPAGSVDWIGQDDSNMKVESGAYIAQYKGTDGKTRRTAIAVVK